MGARVMLIDEDTAATNFMVRDKRMMQVPATMHVLMCMYACICMHVYVCLSMYACMHVGMHVCCML